ncbi:MAG: nucleotidyl transferase AbiEii/AbiGii toxin family protein [Candidatus Pacebacteria bacterium]|nr:nucleotidyl transferase AbiEii/AbiGii toxin family protein [Candidatus Paceibacterota bacterium]MDD5621027.1 nucleotidyl transferase AbiEii/AbiGii toxin family protein [Candidatus Paceibacterota bacterium]
MKSVLTKNQKNILSIISKNKLICNSFYLTGGTALAEFYFWHRLSEDLDFFSEEEFDPQGISVFFKKIKEEAKIKKVEFQQSFNRNLFFLDLTDGDKIKMEFTYFPFERIDKKKKIDYLQIDSLLDIAVNKVFTIYQNPRSRDFIDLYFILKNDKDLSLDDLIKKAQIKFGHYIDPILLGTQYMKVKELKDFPKMLIKIKDHDWQDFFTEEAKEILKKIIK